MSYPEFSERPFERLRKGDDQELVALAQGGAGALSCRGLGYLVPIPQTPPKGYRPLDSRLENKQHGRETPEKNSG
jgi:hypothetical protein